MVDWQGMPVWEGPHSLKLICMINSQVMPAWEVPAHLYGVDALPLLPNGKLDRNRL